MVEIVEIKRLPTKVAYARGFEGDTSLRTGVYSSFISDSSTGPVHKSPAEVDFCRKSKESLIQGGIYLGKLDPSKSFEVGKIRPVIILNSQIILNSVPAVVFICPLSSQSHRKFANLHVELTPRDSLKVSSYALAEHCRAVAITRIMSPRIAQTTIQELSAIIRRLNQLISL
jgi:mRNA interferase MazF